MDVQKAIKTAQTLVEEIKDYSQSQQEFWQRIPLLALEAWGRGEENYDSSILSRAYVQGYWNIPESSGEYGYMVAVDLANGELIRGTDISDQYALNKELNHPPKLARDKDVLSLALNLGVLDAQKIVRDLEQLTQLPYFKHNEAHLELAKKGYRERFDRLTEIFTRE